MFATIFVFGRKLWFEMIIVSKLQFCRFLLYLCGKKQIIIASMNVQKTVAAKSWWNVVEFFSAWRVVTLSISVQCRTSYEVHCHHFRTHARTFNSFNNLCCRKSLWQAKAVRLFWTLCILPGIMFFRFTSLFGRLFVEPWLKLWFTRILISETCQQWSAELLWKYVALMLLLKTFLGQTQIFMGGQSITVFEKILILWFNHSTVRRNMVNQKQ